MKIGAIMLLLMLPGVLAISSTIEEGYHPAETAIFQIQGNILEPILDENVKFLRDGHIESVFDYGIEKMGDSYYVYAVMPYLDLNINESRNYKFVIEDIKTTELGKNVEIDFEQNFSVSGEIATYSITPGIVVSSDDFEINAVLNRDINEPIMVDFPFEREVILKPGQNKIYFNVEDVSGGFYETNVGNYIVPVSLIKEVVEPPPLFVFDPFEIDSVLLIDNKGDFGFKIIYTGEETLEDYAFDYDENIFTITPEPPEIFEPGNVYEFSLSLREENQEVNEYIYLRYGENEFGFPVYVSYTENQEDVVVNDNTVGESRFYCAELQGSRCGSGKICSGDTIGTIDFAECCIGECRVEEGASYAWVGYLIGMVLVAGLFFLGLRYLRNKRQKDVFKERIKKAEKGNGGVLPTF